MKLDLFPTESHDAGGRSASRLAPDVLGGALFGGDRQCYRYRLSRVWRPDAPLVLFIMMMPSVAGSLWDDPTIAKLTRMVRRWQSGRFGGFLVGNCHAYCATDQADSLGTDDPIGPENDAHILAMAGQADLIVMAYGTPKAMRQRARGPAVVKLLRDAGHTLHVLRMGANGPWHPLYLPDATDPVVWS